jgi:hypothetical protein
MDLAAAHDAPMDLAAAHWSNFIYTHIARRWHALWCRWGPSGDLLSRFHAERIFTPSEDGCMMQVVYHYEDGRGTVSDGPACGPWQITQAAHSRADGLAHPSSPDSMTTLLLPGGPSAWCMKHSSIGQPCAVELFLHHGDDLRMSAGVIHNAEGNLQQLSLIREDARGPWPSAGWSSDTQATRVTALELSEALQAAGAPVASRGVGYAITANLQQEPFSAEWPSTRVAAAGSADVVLICAEKQVALVAPERRIEGVGFSSAAAWWPAAGAEAACLYTIEASWDSQGTLEGVRFLMFERPAVSY